ncbi:coiled-coil domain-containing protein [Planoprotostelium fungivorum]|uniref:Coiled-coil domain-containing protein n=1 Tax=Planoprotostelium fungivorum TaxID=1890364 RepID=A0A2P6N541_9EUKA|nr:coiled-coil domain-containing protein [Planoprotostelium fungivorum]
MSDGVEDDYMSADFVTNVPTQRNNIAKQRKRKEPEQTKSLVQREEDSRNEGLSKEISEDNIGFKLLQKMGFKKGKTVGKDTEGSSVQDESPPQKEENEKLVVPISITIKRGKGGLGMDEEKKRQIEEKIDEAMKRQVMQESDFRLRKSSAFAEKKAQGDARKCIEVIKRLDMEQYGDQADTNSPFYKNEEQLKDELADEREFSTVKVPFIVEHDHFAQLKSTQKTIVLNEYLRETYYYCIWCGHQYKNKADIHSKYTCPAVHLSTRPTQTYFEPHTPALK